MRSYTEPTARNLLRRPLVFGVPFFGMVLLAFVVLGIAMLFGSRVEGNLVAVGVGVIGYGVLRVFSRFAKLGWEESLIFPIERLAKAPPIPGSVAIVDSATEVVAPDTLDESDLIVVKEAVADRLRDLRPGVRLTLVCEKDQSGAAIREVTTSGRFLITGKVALGELADGLISDDDRLYSIHQLPVVTDPLWLFGLLSRLRDDFRVVVSFQGTDFQRIKRRIELSRRSNAQGETPIADIDAEVTFEETTRVLQGLSRGDETVVEASLIIASKTPLDLDGSLFCEEKNRLLAAASILGLRRRFHRSHLVRVVTAADLVPSFLDPKEPGPAILTTPRGLPLYFSPQDPRLEALHWLVVGASGSGKSFFTGLILKRMIEDGVPMSVLFVDHNRSFRRLVKGSEGPYFEPRSMKEITGLTDPLFDILDRQGSMAGIELSDLNIDEKRAAAYELLSRIETFLRFRESTHTVYVVLDECWNFMRDEPVLVQRAFREFRKLNGATIAITQSLSDFLTDQSGQSIFQNAPIRILLRQGEDVNRYRGILGMNEVELSKVRLLKQKKGVFSECLVKTPFLSRFGRLYPTESEHALLRTDNLREEWIAEAQRVRNIKRSTPCDASL